VSAQLILAPGKERSLLRRHPWLFAGSVERLVGRARPGDTVEVVADKQVLAKAAWSPESQIRARVCSIRPKSSTTPSSPAGGGGPACVPRLTWNGPALIHAESDGCPVIADRYRDENSATRSGATTSAAPRNGEAIPTLVQATGCARIYERPDSDVRGLEGLEPRTGWLGEAPAAAWARLSSESA
jgi:23S rRNA (cytosine1962-C5)-methyltransferase